MNFHRAHRRLLAIALASCAWLMPLLALAQGAPRSAPRAPDVRPAADVSALVGRPLTRVLVSVEGSAWAGSPPSVRAEPGQFFTPDLVRRSLAALLETGRYADARAEVEPDGAGVLLRIRVVPRRVIAGVRVTRSILPEDALLRATSAQVGRELIEADLTRIERLAEQHYSRHGFPRARARVEAIDTDDPLRVALRIDIEAREAQRIARVVFYAGPDPREPELERALKSYSIRAGARADEEELEAADREFEALLRTRGFHRASVSHRLERDGSGAVALRVEIRAAERVLIRFEGNRMFDADELLELLELDDTDDRSPEALAEKLREHYVRRGRLDAEVTSRVIAEPRAAVSELRFSIREGAALRITRRRFPCLRDPSIADVNSEIDSFLVELPGGEFLGPVDPRLVEQQLGPTHQRTLRHAPRDFSPFSYFVPDAYEQASEHLRELYQAAGFLSASVGPPQLVRKTCDRRSPPGRCLGPPPPEPRLPCNFDAIGLPLEEPLLSAELRCVPDPQRGQRCADEAELYLPIKLGPRSYLYDIGFEGNRVLIEAALSRAAALELGAPLSQAELDRARRRVLDLYAEEGFAFAGVEVELDLSPDHTRARARFVISERERVRVSRIVVKGASFTSERLIRSRIALRPGDIYRRSQVRRTEERLATLGVFGSINVGFEDPYVPAREKVVVVSVEERLPQYIDVRPGISSGEGFRISFEYGHRNLGGEAIQLTLRSQLNFLPQEFIIEQEVREKHADFSTRFGRHNSASVEFPEIGLGPLFRLNVEAIDVRDNARDYSLTKDAGILTLIFRPEPRFSAQLGGSLELNDAEILGDTEGVAQYIARTGQLRTFRVPEGTSFVIAQRAAATWDQRDIPLDATRGFLVSGSVEHVHARPIGETAESERGSGPFDAVTSEFMQYTSRVAGYLRFSKRGLALALSFRWGLNSQLLESSHTYPDRLFFMGGVDTIRGFSQDSLIPEDLAQQLLDAEALRQADPALSEGLTVNQILIRGGDFFVNPRAELRVPITASVQTALFIDTGNLWSTLDAFERSSFRLRYAFGSGIRIGTPVGPLVFDYGFNLERVLDELDSSRNRQRFWEDIGAFHFSIGLF
jgi:outer membrane protein assembly factor BamA